MFQLAKKTEDMNRKSMKASGPSVAKISCVIHHGPFVYRVERVLFVWLEDEAQKRLKISGAAVREKATWLYKHGTVFFFKPCYVCRWFL
jgi:hypothetical protein